HGGQRAGRRDPRRTRLRVRAAQQAARMVGLSHPGHAVRTREQSRDPLGRVPDRALPGEAAMTRTTTTTLTELARLGFSRLGVAQAAIGAVPAPVVPVFALAANPDQALQLLGTLRATAPRQVDALLAEPAATE